MRRIVTINYLTVLFLLLGLAGCHKNDLQIEGLTLPPGSKEVSRTNDNQIETKMQSVGIAVGDNNATGLAIGFNCTKNWSEIVDHFDRQLTSKGFTKSIDETSNNEVNLEDYSAVWTDGENNIVTLSNHVIWTQKHDAPSSNDQGDYGLIIMSRN